MQVSLHSLLDAECGWRKTKNEGGNCKCGLSVYLSTCPHVGSGFQVGLATFGGLQGDARSVRQCQQSSIG